MSVLMTGSVGFIAETDLSVVNLDALAYAGNIESVGGDSRGSRDLFEQVADQLPDATIHLAAELHLDRSIDETGEFIRTNVVGTFTLLPTPLAHWRGLEGREKVRFRELYAVRNCGELGEMYNIGGHNGKTNPQVFYSHCALLDEMAPCSHRVPHAGLIVFVCDVLGTTTPATGSMPRRSPRWARGRASRSDPGLYKTVSWYRNHPDSCARDHSGLYRIKRLSLETDQ